MLPKSSTRILFASFWSVNFCSLPSSSFSFFRHSSLISEFSLLLFVTITILFETVYWKLSTTYSQSKQVFERDDNCLVISSAISRQEKRGLHIVKCIARTARFRARKYDILLLPTG